LTFKVNDSGDSMDISKISSLQFDPSNVKTLPERGMGTFILKSLMDEVGYEIVKGRNVLTMSKSIKTRAPSA
jgi:serine/threonine-protein kinase RsbW